MRETLANLLRMGLEQCRQVGDQLIETGVNCAISRKLRAHLASVESEFRLEVLPGFVDQVGVLHRFYEALESECDEDADGDDRDVDAKLFHAADGALRRVNVHAWAAVLSVYREWSL
jgi:hypothetical protein